MRRITHLQEAETKKPEATRVDDAENPQAVEQFIGEVAFAATTDHLVGWEQVQQAIHAQAPLSHAQRCELFLRAVNGDKLSRSDWSCLVGAPSGAVTPTAIPDRNMRTLRKVLERIIRNPKTAIKSIGADSSAIGNNNVAAFPEKTVVDGRWVLAERILARSAAEALTYALDLFLDPEWKFGANLRQCCHEGCGRFGLAKPRTTPGYPPKFFCTTEHRDAHKKKQSLERANAARASMSVEEFRQDPPRKKTK
jgi:hypothetical protein